MSGVSPRPPIERLAAVVPALDEEAAIGDVVNGLRRAGACCVFVVDGGSSDGTADEARARGAIVIDEPRRGYGRACLTGAEAALTDRPHRHDAVGFLDGDGSCDPADLRRLAAALDDADVVLGRRTRRRLEPGAMPWHARAGNRLVARMIRARTGRPVRDLPPFKVIRHEALVSLRLDDQRFGWTVQFVARALREPGLRVVEQPVAFRRRVGGVSKVSGSLRASVAAARAMVTVAIRETGRRPAFVLVAKAPGGNQVKTRLAVDLGPAATAELWAACLADVGASIGAAAAWVDGDLLVVVPRDADSNPVTRILGDGWHPIVQTRPGLAAALASGFAAAHSRGSDRALVLAGDAPSLPAEGILAALQALDGTRSAVLGPTSDGGYHLIGLRWRAPLLGTPAAIRDALRRRLVRRLTAALAVVPMGASSALEATERGLAASGWHVALSQTWPDLDTLVDLRQLAATATGDGEAAPRTRNWILGHQAVIDDAWNRRTHQEEEVT